LIITGPLLSDIVGASLLFTAKIYFNLLNVRRFFLSVPSNPIDRQRNYISPDKYAVVR